jgi:4-hydroxy-L-threonine phosphate dehydrogenase PdxA
MNHKPIVIVAGEVNSVFFEILFKSFKLKKFRSPIIVISSLKILNTQLKIFRYKKKIRLIDYKNLKNLKLNNNSINLINVNFDKKKTKIYVKKCFEIAFQILISGFTNKFINGPINKTNFLNNKYLGITEYIAKRFKIKKVAMLIYNKDLSVCPITTHLPLKLVSKTINQNIIKEKALLVNDFFKKNIGLKPKIAVTGLNPHCESIDKLNEDIKIISPAIKSLKKMGLKIYGPFPADTIFLKQNRDKYNVILGMYHDQVLAPIKTLKEYDAINITLGLPFFRVSPDHGPNEKMINKNISTPLSLIKAIKFLDQR